MKFEPLPPVMDSIALSDRNSGVFFDVARNGQVTLFSEYSFWTEQPKKICQLTGSPLTFRWKNGWLPVLQAGDRYELFAEGNRLLVRDGEKYSSLPGPQTISRDEFSRCEEKITAYWKKWFAEGLALPETGTDLDHAWKSSLIQALCTFTARHPHYGAHYYRTRCHDAFPPNLLSMTETLLQFGHATEAEEIFLYYFERFVNADGTIGYYGPSLSEYGGIMWTAALLIRQRPASREQVVSVIRPMIYYLLSLFVPRIHPEQKFDRYTLLNGSPEADEREKVEIYFHNNYQILRGFSMLAPFVADAGKPELAAEMLSRADLLEHMLRDAVSAKKQELGLVPFTLDRQRIPPQIQSERESRYANYRYYPELLETAYLDPADAQALFRYREECGGEFHGNTLFTRRDGTEACDNWPSAAYARALLEYGERERFMHLFRAHFRNYISPDTFTAYEQIKNEGDPRIAMAPACVPVQLLLPRMLAWSYEYRKWDGSVVRWGGPDSEILC